TVYLYIVLVAVMVTVFGFNLGAMISSKVRLINIFMLEIYDIDSMVNTFLLGAFAGSFLGGRLTTDTGRVQSIIGGFCFGVIGQCTSVLSPTFSTLFIAEFATGCAFGVYLIAAICYITEIAPAAHRGKCCALLPVFFTLGILIAFFLRTVLPVNGILSVVVIISLSLPLLIVSYLRLPESPRWLALADSSDRALTVLIRLRNSTSEAARELAAINESSLGEDRGISLFFRNSIFRSVLWTLLFLEVALHFSGALVVPYMSMDMVKTYMASVGQSLPYSRNDINFTLLGMVLMAAFLGAMTTFLLVDKLGRRNLLIISSIICESVLLIFFFLNFFPQPVIGPVSTTISLLMFIYGAVIAVSTLVVVIVPELLAAKGRELGMTSSLLVNFGSMMMGMFFFQSAVHVFGTLAVTSIFICCGILLFALISNMLPETKGYLLESMENSIFNERSLKAVGLDRESNQ
ncbi:MAG: MFS transporter, partial [Succinivibrio sp.]